MSLARHHRCVSVTRCWQTLTLGAVGLGLLLSLLLLELHVSKVHDGSDDLIAAVLLLRSEAQRVHGVLQHTRL